MSKFEKIIIPLIDENIRSIDLTDTAGFIDSYTYDPDNPSGEKELFLVFDDTKRNEFTKDRAIRFNKSPNIKKTYIKYIDNKPYFIYSFWVKPDIKKLYNGIITLTTKQKITVLQFWTQFDSIVDLIMDNSAISLGIIHEMPLEDYRPDSYDYSGFTINKKETVSK